MKRTVIKIAALISALSFLLSVFCIPTAAAGEKVNFITPTGAMPPFHNPGANVRVIDVFLTNASGYGYMAEFVYTNSDQVTFFPYWGTGGYKTNQFGFAYHIKSGQTVKTTCSYYLYKQDGTLQDFFENIEYTLYYLDSEKYSYYLWQWDTALLSHDIPGTFSGNAFSWSDAFVPGGSNIYNGSNYSKDRIITTSNVGAIDFTVNGEALPGEEETTGGSGGSVNVDLTETNSWLERIYNKLQEIFTFLPELKDQSGDKVVGAIEDQNKILQDGEEVPTKKDVNSSDLNDAEAELMPGEGEEVTIPEFDQSLVEGSSTYWDMVEQILDTSGLKPIIIFSLAIGLAAFIIGRKV